MKKCLYLNICIIQAILITLTSSCVDQKQIAYFQKGVNQSDTIAVADAYVPRIQPADILAINIGSLNPLASSFFNPYSTMPVTTDNNNVTATGQGAAAQSSSGSGTAALTQSTAPGYLVGVDGTVEIPLLGNLKLSGLTTTEAKYMIKNKLKLYLKEPTVSIRFLNYKISVIGEVMRPSVYIIPNERITLPEALGMAGDMTIYGKRENVLIIRTENGKNIFGRVNLNTRELYTSPYYYLHANDIVYVEPSKGRIAQTDKTYQILPIILSALSFIVIIFTYSRKGL